MSLHISYKLWRRKKKKSNTQPWFAGQISQLLLQFIMGLAEESVHFYKSSSFAQKCYFNNIQILIIWCLKPNLVKRRCRFLQCNLLRMKRPVSFFWKACGPSRSAAGTQRWGWAHWSRRRINQEHKMASKILVISTTVKICETIKLQKPQTFKIGLIADQGKYQTDSITPNPPVSGFERYISFYSLHFTRADQHRIHKDSSASHRCDICKDFWANFSVLLKNSQVASGLYPNGCNQKTFLFHMHAVIRSTI